MARLLEKYELGARIGCGGMAEVFEGEVHGVGGFRRSVAIKRVHPTFSADPVFAERFVKEAVLSAQLDHPNIVSVIDFDRDDSGRLFLVMERVHGPDLRQLLRTGRLPVAVAAHIAAEILRGLRHAHEQGTGGRGGVLHRDISPHNVLLSWNGEVKVSDFGIAKAMDGRGASFSGRVKGKLSYMSPEQARGLRLDARSDLFAVGVVLHELLTGRSLFRSGPVAEVLACLMSQPIPKPSSSAPMVPAPVDAVVLRLLARDREARYASADAALEALSASGALAADGADAVATTLRDRFGPNPEVGRETPPTRAFSESQPSSAPTRGATEPTTPGRRRPARASRTLTPTAEPAATRLGGWSRPRLGAPKRTRRSRALTSILAAALTRVGK
jgi:serine/threonine protein kinase